MNFAWTRLGSMLGIFAVVTGLTAIACTAAPTAPLNGVSDDQTEKKDTSSTLPPSNPARNNGNAAPPSGTPAGGSTADASIPDASTPTIDAGASTTPPPAGNAQLCASSGDFDACFDCCDQQNPGGMAVDHEAWKACACQTPGVCKLVCGNNFCAGGQPSFACQFCLDENTSQCDAAADAACQASAACTAAFACTGIARCFDKP